MQDMPDYRPSRFYFKRTVGCDLYGKEQWVITTFNLLSQEIVFFSPMFFNKIVASFYDN